MWSLSNVGLLAPLTRYPKLTLTLYENELLHLDWFCVDPKITHALVAYLNCKIFDREAPESFAPALLKRYKQLANTKAKKPGKKAIPPVWPPDLLEYHEETLDRCSYKDFSPPDPELACQVNLCFATRGLTSRSAEVGQSVGAEWQMQKQASWIRRSSRRKRYWWALQSHFSLSKLWHGILTWWRQPEW